MGCLAVMVVIGMMLYVILGLIYVTYKEGREGREGAGGAYHTEVHTGCTFPTGI